MPPIRILAIPARRTHACALAALALFAVAGCSDMKFVNARDLGQEGDDARENLVLSGMTADFTSGSQLQHRVHSRRADLTLLPSARRMRIVDVKVDSFNPEGRLQGKTRADRGTVFLTDVPGTSPLTRRGKNDIEFAGNVKYRIPSAKDPTTDTVWLETEALRWDSSGQRFRSEAPYRMTMATAGKPPVLAVGDGFAVSQDLKVWNVRHGGLGMGGVGDMRTQNERRSAQAAAETESRENAGKQSRTDGEAELPVSAPGKPGAAGPTAEVRDTAAGPRKYARLPASPRVSTEQTTAEKELVDRAVRPLDGKPKSP